MTQVACIHPTVAFCDNCAHASMLTFVVACDVQISSHVEDLADCFPSATPFPAGALFASETSMRAESPGPAGWVIPGDAAPGRLLSFVSSHVSPNWRSIRV